MLRLVSELVLYVSRQSKSQKKVRVSNYYSQLLDFATCSVGFPPSSSLKN